MTLDEVAEKLGCSENTVRKLHRTGKLRGLRLAGRIRMRLSTVERFMAELEAAP